MPILIMLTLLLLPGCAFLTNGTTQELSFQTNPEQVTVTLIPKPPVQHQPRARADGGAASINAEPIPESRLLGHAPLRVTLDRADGQSIIFSKAGYKPLTMELTTRMHPAFWGNILFGGLIGSATDQASGAAYEYVPNQYFVTLIPLESTSIDRNTGQAQRDKAIVFIVRRYAAIMADLSRGSGEDWTALLGVLQIGPGQDAAARDKIRAFATIYPDAANFATHVADFYTRH